VPSADEPPIDQPATTPKETTVNELIAEAQAHSDRMDRALEKRDFATFGEEYKKLKETLDKLAKAKK
jgi:uncharacterized membrane protein (UPF0182 family)